MKILSEISRDGVEYIYNANDLYAIILRNEFKAESVTFFTSKDLPQQLGYLPLRKGQIIQAHIHRNVNRNIIATSEVLFIKKGKVKVNFYNNFKQYIFSKIINEGDVILLCSGGHGFEILEETIMIEVKQGPYAGIHDKEKFEGIEKSDTGK